MVGEVPTLIGVTQDEAYETLCSGHSCFLTGSAGSGKSYLIHRLIAELTESGNSDFVALTASTGIAAKNIGGCTLNYFLGYGLGRNKKEIGFESDKEFLNRCSYSPHFNKHGIQNIHALILDEVSMLPARIVDDLDLLFRHFRNDPSPFGGCQMIFVGDLLQIPPVTNAPRVPWCFKAKAWKAADVRKVQLTKIYRQADEKWIKHLNDMRFGKLDDDIQQYLYDISVEDYPDPKTYDGTIIMTHNRDVEDYNMEALNSIPGKSRTFWGVSSGNERDLKELKEGMITPDRLELKIGARVIMTVNKKAGVGEGDDQYEVGFVNGTFATIIDFLVDGVMVELETGEELTIKRNTWDNAHLKDGEATASFRQYPMRLAYALSVHKCQGLTLTKVFIDAAKAFVAGQFYVAMSRCKTLEGISIRNFNPGSCWADFEAKAYYHG